ncbi:hypothetical protein POM88_018829 [Heracleum sosnowskyi]|uniref:Uncharacterized protein n=1 Tax=Heracleum sosnowskyi TaxID=360622 RepID=A0AAD8IS55_9APIA|nr:hypothetical protein POM88_018829 [Heracleum sosnowskyi]
MVNDGFKYDLKILQDSQNFKTAPYPSKLLNLSELALALQNYDNGLSLDVIIQVYNNLDGKEKYEGNPPSMFKNIKLESINLTVFHLYEDLSPVGKKLPLLFANQGPPLTVLQKKNHRTVLNHNNGLCGLTTLSEQEGCFASLEEMLEFVTKRMGEDIKLVSPLAGKWQKYMVSRIPKIISR